MDNIVTRFEAPIEFKVAVTKSSLLILSSDDTIVEYSL